MQSGTNTLYLQNFIKFLLKLLQFENVQSIVHLVGAIKLNEHISSDVNFQLVVQILQDLFGLDKLYLFGKSFLILIGVFLLMDDVSTKQLITFINLLDRRFFQFIYKRRCFIFY